MMRLLIERKRIIVMSGVRNFADFNLSFISYTISTERDVYVSR